MIDIYKILNPEESLKLRKIEDDVINGLKEFCNEKDKERNHSNADKILITLLEGIGFKKVAEEFNKVGKWYS